MTSLLIFDFDGVVADSEILANQVLAECVTELGVPTTLEDSYRQYMGKRFPDVMAAVEKVIGRALPVEFPETFQSRTLDRFRSGLQSVPGAKNFLAMFADMPKCIASSSSPDRLALCLDILDLAEIFGSNVFSATMVERGKPHPDIFLHAAREMQVPPSDATVIEDSTSGVAAGISAGMTVIGLLAASHIQPGDGDKLTAAGAHHVVRTFAEVEEIVRQLQSRNSM